MNGTHRSVSLIRISPDVPENWYPLKSGREGASHEQGFAVRHCMHPVLGDIGDIGFRRGGLYL